MKPLKLVERLGVILLLLVAWWLRWAQLLDVPPGWRDDDLIELYTFSARIMQEGPELYFAGASGHEPLYHTLRAPLVAAAGVNAASARLMSSSAGLLAIVLTWAVGRRVLGRGSGFLGATLVTVSFWSLMYSRVAIRHMGALPWMCLALYWAWRVLRNQHSPRGAMTGLAIGTAGSLLTYYAGRLMPALLIALYPIIAPEDVWSIMGHALAKLRQAGAAPRLPEASSRFAVQGLRRRRLQRYVLGLGLGILLSVPMFWAAARIPGADARVSEVAIPLTALREGNIRPLLQTTWTTLGMFHAKGDPEWLYNYSERPVFGPVGAALFYLSLLIGIVHWRRPESRFLLLWLIVGVSPAFISLPPSSYGHCILALPAVYLLLASHLKTLTDQIRCRRRWRSIAAAVSFGLLCTIGARDLSDYFIKWPGHSMVQFLYRADYRALAHHLCDGGAEPHYVGVGSMLYGVWDRVALQTDCPEVALHARWFNPERAIVFAQGQATRVYLQHEGNRHPQIAELIAEAETIAKPTGMEAYQVQPWMPPTGAVSHTLEGVTLASQPLADAVQLEAAAWVGEPTPGSSASIATWWHVKGDLPLPPERLVSQPPPPGVYSGPPVRVFAHLWAGERLVGIDDGIWADAYSLGPGDWLLQMHSFELPEEASEYVLEIGIYDAQTGERWTTPVDADKLEVPLSLTDERGNN